ncbi:MAG: cell division ATP-binding protein FtsE [Azospirillum sp.]|nr:cell division ATP-binding protein FtsE [Azospirillum sp.]
MIRFENIGLRYGSGPEILRDISFMLAPGSFHFLTGASGAGKSSLLRLIYLSLRPTRGSLTVFGQNIDDLSRDQLPALRRKIGVVFQNFRLLDHLSALDNVALPLRMAGLAEAQVQDHVSELLRWVGLGNHLDAKPPTLSGGQQQRVAIARSVINRPRLILADEPTGNVDDGIGMRLLYLFEELNKLGTTMIIATHNEGLVEQFRHPRLHLENGTLTVIPPAGGSEG